MKSVRRLQSLLCAVVAPFTGAWIEMPKLFLVVIALTTVAPFTGAWIEMESGIPSVAVKCGRTLHGCVD